MDTEASCVLLCIQGICQHVEGTLVVAEPLTCYRRPTNEAELRGSVALVQRGGGA